MGCTVSTPGLVRARAQKDQDPWSNVVEKASQSMGMLRINQTRAFAGEGASSSIATGFVVDAQRGIILTNRHVVTIGPTRGDCVFVVNQEEVVVKPLYRDPVHDFGFFSFDPSCVKFQDLVALQLYPEGAKIGTEVRVVGSDAGEKIMVLQGVISRVDRDPPEYDGSYVDYDTFYISSASSTSGGSSGSPVLDIEGRCIALNCGGALLASTSFFLPLDRVAVALKHVQAGELRPPRGTLQATFKRLPMDEARRLGLRPEDEAAMRKATLRAQGVMSIDKIIPNGPGALAGLREGDLLLRINDELILDFIRLEEKLDGAVASKIPLKFNLQRGDTSLKLDIVPGSLWEALPNTYLEYSGGVFHSIPYQLAVESGVALNAGAYVASPGFAFGRAGVAPGCIIFQVGDRNIQTLTDLTEALSPLAEGFKVPIRFFHIGRKHVPMQQMLTHDREWYLMSLATLNGTTGLWDYELIAKPSPATTAAINSGRPSASSCSSSVDGEAPATSPEDQPAESTSIPSTPPKPKRRPSLSVSSGKRGGKSRKAKTKKAQDFIDLELTKEVLFEAIGIRCLVQVFFDVAHPIDGNARDSFEGVGIVVDVDRRLVLCDRNTCVTRAGDVRLVFASAYEVTGRVLYSHPLQNFCFVQFDAFDAPDLEIVPIALEPLSVESMTVRKGDVLIFIGMSQQHHIISTEVSVTSVERANVFTPVPPRFSAKNFDVVNLDQEPSGCLGGFFVDTDLKPRAMWTSFSFQENGEDAEEWYATLIAPVAQTLAKAMQALDADPAATPSSSSAPILHSFGIEFGRVEMSEARQLGMTDEYVKSLGNVVDEIHASRSGSGGGGMGAAKEVLKIHTLMAGTQPSKVLKSGDLLLTVNGKALLSYYLVDLEAEECGKAGKQCIISVLRDGKVVDCAVSPIPLSLTGTSKLVFFAGLQLQETFESVLFHGFFPAELEWSNGQRGVYVSGIMAGSPAQKHEINPLCWILDVDGKPVPNLTAFMEAVTKFSDESSIRLRIVDLNGSARVASLRLDLHYFPTIMMESDLRTGTWRCNRCPL